MNNKTILTESQVAQLILTNKYKVDDKNKYSSRCIDGRYENEDNLFPQAFPGGDIGELALILATANSFGFEVDQEKAFEALTEVIGGVKNFGFHSDHHGDPKKLASGCGHFKQINLDPKSYTLEEADISFIKEKLIEVEKKGGKQVVLEGDHLEGVILLIRGNWAVYPRFTLEESPGQKLVEVFEYHQSLTDEKHRLLAKKLLEKKAVEFKLGEDVEYLYQALSDTAEAHLMETVKRLAPDLPIYQVIFDENGSFKVKNLT